MTEDPKNVVMFPGVKYAPMKSDLVDIEVTLHHETDRAWLVSDDGERRNAAWIPKSQAELGETDRKGVRILTLPERTATEKGLT